MSIDNITNIDQSTVYTKYGRLCRNNLKDFAQSKQYLEKAIELHSKNAKAHFEYAILLQYNFGQFEQVFVFLPNIFFLFGCFVSRYFYFFVRFVGWSLRFCVTFVFTFNLLSTTHGLGIKLE